MSSVKRKRRLKSYGGFVQGTGERFIGELTNRTWEYTRDYVRKHHYKTGKLYRSIRKETHRSANGWWGILKSGGPGAKHANLIQYGVGRHIIRSKDSNKQDALMIPGVGPREYVVHPGFKGSNFMRKGMNKARRELKKLWSGSVAKTYAKQKRR